MVRGLQEQQKDGGVFLSIKHFCLCEESKESREGFKAIQVRNPRTEEESTKWIKPYGALEAYVNRIEWRDTGDQYEQRYMSWKIHLEANGQKYILDLPFESRVSTRFMKLAENIDYSRPVEFRAWKDKQTEGTAFFVGQRENDEDEKSVSVGQVYTRDNPGECPPPVQKFNGKWSFDAQTEFLYQRMIDNVIPTVEAANAMRAENNGHQLHDIDDEQGLVGVVNDAGGALDDEDIPF